MDASDISGVDLDFRPKSYFWPLGIETHLLARIKGVERKAALQLLLDSGKFDAIPEFLAQSSLSEANRRFIGRIHPSFMGGEYLPDLKRTEVMIARITIASTTRDVTSVFARRGKNRIHYRVVDEYGGDTLSGRNTRTSVAPLTLGQLETFFNGAWSIFGVLDRNFSGDGYALEKLQAFVVGVDSAFYPGLDSLYRQRIARWAAGQRGSGTPAPATRKEERP